MRYRILASFQGAPYEAGVGPDESDVVLFAACPPPEELRFEPATGHWRKRVSRGQVQMLYESRPVGMFRGERCIVLDDLSDRLHIVYLGHDAVRAAQLGYWEVDRGVFELITPRHEVTDIVEQRLPLPIRSDSGQHTRPEPMPSERPDDHSTPGGNSVPYSGVDSPLFGYGGSSSGQSDVAIPPVPEPPLPLEAEALRAASSAARRGQKSGQSRQAQEARSARRPHPAVEPAAQAAAGQELQPPVEPAPLEPAPLEPAPPTVPPAPLTAQAPTPVEPVQAATAPAEATIAPAQAAGVSQPMPAPVPAAAAMLSKAAMLSHAAATAARLAAASSKQSDPEAAPTAASGEPSTLAPDQVAMAGMAETAATPVGQPADAAARVDQPAIAPVAASEPVDAQAYGPDEPRQDALSDMPATASGPYSAPVRPASEHQPLAELAEPAPAPSAETATTADPATTAEPATDQSALATPDHADGTAVTPVVGISDPPSVALPAAASTVPSWIPQGPVQPQPGFDAVQPVQVHPMHDIAPVQAGYYVPYMANEPMPPNGTATANGATAAVDLYAQPEPLQPSDEVSEPAAPAEAEPGATTRRRRGTKRRLPTQKIFSDLATAAAIPAAAYAIGEEVDGAMCLVRTDEGFEVFNAAGGARHEVRVFQDEESAYFYLFGVLVAESVRTGALLPRD
jgi:hypothetical protein